MMTGSREHMDIEGSLKGKVQVVRRETGIPCGSNNIGVLDSVMTIKG